MSGPTYTEQLLSIVDQYIASRCPWPATARQIASWAIDNDLWAPYPAAMIRKCAEDIARAMREEYIVDPQGRRVRAKHAMKTVEGGEQMTLWADIRDASPQHMRIAFQQRRQQIIGDCRQLKIDVDSYNENANPAAPIQMVFDFTEDLAELEAAEYAQSFSN